MLLLRTIYKCRLVHGDFSEYNLLWYKSTVCIDVSQAVEHDHPNALTFLRKDCENAIHFFRKYGVANVPSLQRLFEFVTSPLIKGDAAAEAAYDRMLEEQGAAEDAENRAGDDDNGSEQAGECATAAATEAAIKEAVFMQMHIPRTMEELGIKQAEKDIEKVRRGEGENLAYMKLMGLNADGSIGADIVGGGGSGEEQPVLARRVPPRTAARRARRKKARRRRRARKRRRAKARKTLARRARRRSLRGADAAPPAAAQGGGQRREARAQGGRQGGTARGEAP